MFKIISDIGEINQINDAQNNMESGTKYCDVLKHCMIEEFAIPLMPLILKKYNLPFITEEWLNKNIVNELPIGWEWCDIDRPHRLIIPSKILSDAIIKGLIIKVIENNLTTTSSDEKQIVYYTDLNGDEYILELYPEIIKEDRPVI